MDKHKNYGKVPQYIEKIKDEMAVQKEIKKLEKEKAKLPPGTHMMSEEERIQTLEELERQKNELYDMLRSMPLSMRTESLKNKKRDLELKLVEVEKAINTFSRKVVYVVDQK